MRTPQRSFVVEFKSGRRPPKAGTNSIWGDTDLKAVAREVEDEASHLFRSNEVPSTPDAGGDVLPDVINAGSSSEDAGDLDVARATIPSVNGAEVDVPKQHEVDRLVVQAVAQGQESQPTLRSQATSEVVARKRAERAPRITRSSTGAHEDQNTQSKTAMAPISLGEVAALDTENKRLKRLLAKQLRAQNQQLKKMLERFDII
ncbi:hypothetical protein G6L29_30585 [Agrobacterium rhizogenes]|uniref:hypothetical protein n=1 Tax=Rhizobium rhizogenes TaxID=359 RepID=UPI00115F275F|nr:hypothetical protein [Rhizobium rhizogenes]NTG05325.1 hypothetical protein [Rhizobium rhizogenes]NTG11911.1 hypothetical protein [Rhizobium rhizogenes]NTG90741.1 hypothetical protein [Rhizobium rhizogenes]NTI20014.1 hypothetical protein [Rhizobium rhizogenes]NTI39404.1 hypothetical protein [Rhizobium rhizogenes]